MPARNSIKTYVENGYYHIYNRGVEKRQIFLDQQDYSVFLSYLKDYLSLKNEKELHARISDKNLSWKEKETAIKLLRMNNFSEDITLLAYCLMPNHFHFLIKQKSSNAIDRFMQSIGTRYTMYFNKKYKRVGSLFQAVYKAVLVSHEAHFLHLSRYIHKQALLKGEPFKNQQPCSYEEYLGKRTTPWIHPGEILAYFSKTSSTQTYESFMNESEDLNIISPFLLEDETDVL